jgi:hypothetical protein
MLMPKKQITWGCMAESPEICARQLSTIRFGKGHTLRDTPWAAELREAKGSLVGVTSLLGVAALMTEIGDATTAMEAQMTMDIVNSLPEDGDFPLTLVGKTTFTQSGSGKLQISMKFPKAAIPYDLLSDETE